jgi:hypothetical protein
MPYLTASRIAAPAREVTTALSVAQAPDVTAGPGGLFTLSRAK